MNEITAALLKQIPKVDEMLARPVFAGSGGHLLLQAVRQVLDELREGILHGDVITVPSFEELENSILSLLEKTNKPHLRRVINGTGIILHTNLGRAPLAREALTAVNETARGYSNLEYDIENATRGSRHSHVEGLLTQLTGAEAAMAVNNNAAAVLLALSALAHDRDVIISRGELVEIGGSFRIPDVMTQSGCRLVEVGTTNKTHLKDYENALTAGAHGRGDSIRSDCVSSARPLRGLDVQATLDIPPPACPGAIFRVHASNFKMSGFVSRPSLSELIGLCKKNGIPLIEDLGSGAILPVHNQPTVSDSINAGADIVTFSGDKLLGGPQAGLIVGRAELIGKMKKHPLARALRIDKLSLAALEATLRLYLDPATAVQKIPALRMLYISERELSEKANRLQTLLGTGEIINEPSQAGGGAMPEENLPSAAVSINHPDKSAQEIEGYFRESNVPIIGRISQGRFLLDVRTIDEADFPLIAERYHILNGESQ
ncbi:MAG: L-seryl-tRNA(Sec) selenium transferase [Defluviitaleaceae bacterium]|nr:L-seryl-tRNA(Sec) selenium transferase [Defluviitaleaceae bacterium]